MECFYHLGIGVVLTLNADFSPSQSDPRLNWARRDFDPEFARLMKWLVATGRVSQEKLVAAGPAKIKLRLQNVVEDLAAAIRSAAATDEQRRLVEGARRAINS